MSKFFDSHARPINYLRISVTDRCNLRCVYCMPPEGIPLMKHEDILTFEEIMRVVRAAAGMGIHKIRLTGGEPLARIGLPDLVHMIAGVPEIDDISLTTNGHTLPRYAKELAEAGLDRVNVSLDSFYPDRFRTITRVGDLDRVWAGIKAAKEAGLTPIKINVVALRGFNDDELVDMARSTIETERHIRFIEVMPLAHNELWASDGFISMGEVKERIEASLGQLQPVGEDSPVVGNGPARYWRFPGAPGTLGFISPVSDHFCAGCNRLRLTADGRLRPCLLSDMEIDIKSTVRSGKSETELIELITEAIRCKPECHHLELGEHPVIRDMAQIGG
ncbi:MAG: GTP 3',8-cyclase MoaA [Anaerolineales bacterium]|nr:GTP 3',8-cyclase MoaA [Anaerolineales bacterium]